MGFDSKHGLHNTKCLCKLPFYLIIYDKYFLVSLNILLNYIFLVPVDKYLCKLPFFFSLRYSLENSIKLKTVLMLLIHTVKLPGAILDEEVTVA